VIRRSTGRFVLAALLVPLALIVGLRSAWALYACRADGVVRTSCCCHGAHEAPKKRAPSNDAHVVQGSCCDVTVQAPASAPQLRDTERASVQAPIAVVAIAETPPPPSPQLLAISIDRPNARPPPVATFLIKQSFLR
jgi:hypothetical protein